MLAQRHLFEPREVDITHGEDHLHIGGESFHAVVDAKLIVAFAAGAVNNRVTLAVERLPRNEGADKLARHARRTGVALIIDIGANGKRQPLGQLRLCIEKAYIQPEMRPSLLCACQLILTLPHIYGIGNHERMRVLFAEEDRADYGIEATGKAQRSLHHRRRGIRGELRQRGLQIPCGIGKNVRHTTSSIYTARNTKNTPAHHRTMCPEGRERNAFPWYHPHCRTDISARPLCGYFSAWMPPTSTYLP